MEMMSAVSQIPLRMVLYVALLSLGITNALDCYICTYLDGYSDDSCVTNASSVKVLNCSTKYCLTMRQESIRNASKVISFLRDCQDKPMLPNGNTPDGSFRTYYSSCQQNLCNGHNGRIKNSTGGAASSGSGIHNAIVPGKNTGHSSSHGNGQAFAFAFGLGLFLLLAKRLRCCLPQL